MDAAPSHKGETTQRGRLQQNAQCCFSTRGALPCANGPGRLPGTHVPTARPRSEQPCSVYLRRMEPLPVLGFFQECLLSCPTSLLAEMAITARPLGIENRKVHPTPSATRCNGGVSLYTHISLVYTALHWRELLCETCA